MLCLHPLVPQSHRAICCFVLPAVPLLFQWLLAAAAYHRHSHAMSILSQPHAHISGRVCHFTKRIGFGAAHRANTADPCQPKETAKRETKRETRESVDLRRKQISRLPAQGAQNCDAARMRLGASKGIEFCVSKRGAFARAEIPALGWQAKELVYAKALRSALSPPPPRLARRARCSTQQAVGPSAPTPSVAECPTGE